MRNLVLVIAGIALSISPTMGSTQRSEYVVVATRIDNVRSHKSIFDGMRECAENNICASLVTAGSQYFGIPVDKVIAAGALLSDRSQGEGTWMSIGLPDGYSYCKARMETVSIVPNDGPRGSLFLARADSAGLSIETWTPVLPPLQGRSWVEANISVVGVRNDLAAARIADGTCRRGNERHLVYCRGGGCENPRVTEDNGQNVDVSSPPGARSRK